MRASASVVFDPAARCGGILHMMLPESAVSPQKAMTQPAMFADTGLPLLFRELAGLKARTRASKVVRRPAAQRTSADRTL